MGKHLKVELTGMQKATTDVTEESTSERLSSLAQRRNTYIDNPYQQKQIKNNFTKESL